MKHSENTNRVCAVIPFYNEAKFIDDIICETLKFADYVIAVNDGSNDGFLIDCKKNNFEIISHKINLGKGSALTTGLERAAEMDFDFVVTLDADFQHPPELIPKFIEAVRNADLVVGNRMNDISPMPFSRKISNALSSMLLSAKTGTIMKDTQNGFRIFRAEKLKEILPSFNGFEAESEMLVKAAKNGMKIKFIDVPTIYNDNESKMKNVETIIGFLKVLFKK
ncbi:MAG: glycosyltransferase family 2 protein [Chlorobi bacterium]|nr:glycosyltransferase family 2 protein [Chlorobiota bacterium]